MSSELIDLGRRAVACKGWRCGPGVKSLPDAHGRVWRVCQSERGGLRLFQEAGRRLRERAPEIGNLIPDLSDPATLGCLLALVIEHHPTARIQFIQRIDSGERHAIVTWEALDGRTHSTGKRPTAEALVAALEAAP